MAALVNHFLRWRWFFVAAIVGTLLNLINQWDGIIGDAALEPAKLIMTYVVPYLVSSISGWYATAN